MHKEVLKGTRWLLLKNAENLDAEKDEKRQLEEALALNEPLATAYYMKEDLRRFWEQPGKRFATTFLDGWIRRAEASGIKMLQQMAKTLAAHRSGLLAYYDVMITSGPMEGTNNKIKTMKRQAYGFRDLEFFKLKILAIILLSWLVNHGLLYLVALADTRGRTTTDTARPEENLELWRLVAEENDCFDRPYAFANDHARFLFYTGTLSSLHYTPREEHCCTVTLMSGLPGSGKDTWLTQQRPELPVVSLDDLRGVLDVDPEDDQGEVIQLARERCREHLRAGRHFAFNATNTMRQTRKRWIDLFADYGARIELVYIEPPLSLIFERNSRRPRPVPARVIERLVDKLEPPTWIEAHSLTMIAGSARG